MTLLHLYFYEYSKVVYGRVYITGIGIRDKNMSLLFT